MIAVLRFIGIVNAAVWLGSVVFFTFAAGPAVFSQDMKNLLGGGYSAYSGLIAMIFLKRYFILHYVCAGIAIAHLIAECLYTGRPVDRTQAGVLGALLGLALLGGLWLQPKMKGLQAVKYSRQATAVERQRAAVHFRRWHGVSQAANLFMLGGILFSHMRVLRPTPVARYQKAHTSFWAS